MDLQYPVLLFFTLLYCFSERKKKKTEIKWRKRNKETKKEEELEGEIKKEETKKEETKREERKRESDS